MGSSAGGRSGAVGQLVGSLLGDPMVGAVDHVAGHGLRDEAELLRAEGSQTASAARWQAR